MATITYTRGCRYCDRRFYGDTLGELTASCSEHEQECPDRIVADVKADENGELHVKILGRAADQEE